jgi:hypothetical protein
MSSANSLGEESFDSLELFDVMPMQQFHVTDAQHYNDISGRYSIRQQDFDRSESHYNLPFAEESALPNFIALRNMVLRFWCYFVDVVPGNTRDSIRNRKCELNFFLEDGHIEVVELIDQGIKIKRTVIVRRQPIMKPNSSRPYGVEDLRIGRDISIFARVFHIIDCDQFTRDYMLETFDEELGEPLEMPEDEDDPSAIGSRTKRVKRPTQQAVMKARQKADFAAFLKCDKVILRFLASCDERERLFGDVQDYTISYFLVDDTIEIMHANKGSDSTGGFPKLLKRSRVPKPITPEFLASTGGEGAEMPMEFFHWMDFFIGAQIPIFGKILRIRDADSYTRSFFQQEGMPLARAIPEEAHQFPTATRPIPPHNGFGSEEDSLQTCNGSLIPKVIKKDGLKAKEKSGQVLRFRAKLISTRREDASREFLVLFFLVDDTIMVRETPNRNSGFVGGKFLSRNQTRKPDGSYYQATDLHIGATLTLFNHVFVLSDADEYTLRYMEGLSNRYPYSDLVAICDKIRSRGSVVERKIALMPSRMSSSSSSSSLLLNRSGSLNALETTTSLEQQQQAPSSSSYLDQVMNKSKLSYDQVKDLFMSCNVRLNQQELVTFLRAMDRKKTGYIRSPKVLKVLRDEEWIKNTLRR